MELAGKSVLILGLGESGLAMARWCDQRGARVRVLDSRAAPPMATRLAEYVPAAQCAQADLDGAFDSAWLSGIDLIAVSPGLSVQIAAIQAAHAQQIPVVGEIELFAWALAALPQARNARVLAITGTNGKTTTTALTAHLCQAAGLDAQAAGNISPSALDALMLRLQAGKLPDVWVLELSSFQLETTHTLSCTAAAVLNLSEDHLDRHGDRAAYAAAKARIFRHSRVAVVNRDDAPVMALVPQGLAQRTFGLDAPSAAQDFGLMLHDKAMWLARGKEELLPLNALPLAGRHNAANVLAALALCACLDLDQAAVLTGLRRFTGLPHRVALVAEHAGVRWYDDSKGTNVGATQAAVCGLGCRSVVILGGDGKGQDFSPLAADLAAHARAVVLIGRDAPMIREAIASELAAQRVPVESAPTLEAAVVKAAQLAQDGDAVLLSPACASFDMFRDYAHRAEVFVRAVKALIEKDHHG